ncbi:MAG TPA: sigma-70 family RNA polymerase sigma factor [Pirellulales bacterium]|jgi:RNA polymerase sigma factor (sigma-70 family)|nr:sigma-70 family RNA polymerase sigma factor [Pirellulales bacterium]
MDKPQAVDANEWARSVVADYEGPLVRYAARITGDVHRARDVVQDTFLRLCEQDRHALDGHLAEWLYTVCRRRALDVQRKEHRMRATLPEELDGCAAGHQPREAVDRQESHEAVLAAISRLPDNQQEVVRLKFQSGLSYREIAGVTGLSVSNVGYLLHVALKTVREQCAETTAETSD